MTLIEKIEREFHAEIERCVNEAVKQTALRCFALCVSADWNVALSILNEFGLIPAGWRFVAFREPVFDDYFVSDDGSGRVGYQDGGVSFRDRNALHLIVKRIADAAVDEGKSDESPVDSGSGN